MYADLITTIPRNLTLLNSDKAILESWMSALLRTGRLSTGSAQGQELSLQCRGAEWHRVTQTAGDQEQRVRIPLPPSLPRRRRVLKSRTGPTSIKSPIQSDRSLLHYWGARRAIYAPARQDVDAPCLPLRR